jgi:hypothetical protein
MSGGGDGLRILLEERERNSIPVPKDLVETVYGIEERVQFDEKRSEAPAKIAASVRGLLDREIKGGNASGNAS